MIKINKKVALIVSLVFLVVIILIVSKAAKAKDKILPPEIIPVKVMKIELRNLDETLDYVGDIKAQDEAYVYPKVSGKVIEKLKEDGQPIKKYEAIVLIDRDEVGLKFEKAPVESTLSGTVGRNMVDIGENVNVLTPVAYVVNMETVKINLDIPEKYLPRVKVGQMAKIKVDAYPEQEFLGKVTKISPVLDLSTRAAPIEIKIENKDHRLNSGMFARVSLLLEEHQNVPVVLKESIIGKDSKAQVFTVENNQAKLKDVVLGIRQGQLIEVKEGLKENDLVVIMGQQRLYEGAPVKAEE